MRMYYSSPLFSLPLLNGMATSYDSKWCVTIQHEASQQHAALERVAWAIVGDSVCLAQPLIGTLVSIPLHPTY